MALREEFDLHISAADLAAMFDMSRQHVQQMLQGDRAFEVGMLLMALRSPAPDELLLAEVVARTGEYFSARGKALLMDRFLRDMPIDARTRWLMAACRRFGVAGEIAK